MAKSRSIEVRTASGSYPVIVGHGALQELPRALEQVGLKNRLRVVADKLVAEKHGRVLLACLRSAGRSAEMLDISGQERDKNLAQVARVYDWLVKVGTDRSDAILAFGGGAVGDLVGFVAATFHRGLPLVHLPTTVLAMVDSSIGGKTGVDHTAGKNLIGAFHQPNLVVADLDLLATLPSREISAGWAEVIKMGVVCSAELFGCLEAHPAELLSLQAEAERPIARSIELKGEIVSGDEREQGRRMVLNYGHTIGHAIEAATGFGRFLHGEAVSIGMIGAAEIARRMGRLQAEAQLRQVAVLQSFGLPTSCPGLDLGQLWEPMLRDKKARGNRLRWVVPTGIGSAEIVDSVPEVLVRETLAYLVRN